jgi:DNA-nicking Smr family endonuclease
MPRRDDDDGGERPPFNSPFRGLGKLVGPLPSGREPAQKRMATRTPVREPAADDSELFASAVKGVVPIPASERDRSAAAPRSRAGGTIISEEAAALAELADLVSGEADFDVSDTDEHVEGIVSGLDPRLLRRLRAGEFAYQAHLDLHGLTVAEARTAVRDFVLTSMVRGHRCVLLVHGRGRNSPEGRSVLKDRLKEWLTRGELGRRVLAFSTARPYDGGSGATYVLLRRERRGKKTFRTLVGAKS